jgi:hypothetical protein
MPGLEISIITAKFKTKAEEPQISRFFSKLLDTYAHKVFAAQEENRAGQSEPESG